MENKDGIETSFLTAPAPVPCRLMVENALKRKKIRGSFAKLFRQNFEIIYKLHKYDKIIDIYKKKCINFGLILIKVCANIDSQRNLTKLTRR